MKNYLATTLAATGMIIFIFGMDGRAQNISRIVADVPFDFYVGKELLPKGKYEFEPANRQSYPGPLVVRPVAKTVHRALIVPATAASVRSKGDGFAIVFNRYGTEHYLSAVSGGDAGGLALRVVPSLVEKELARRFEGPHRITILPNETVGR
jgi:hypothetical protein